MRHAAWLVPIALACLPAADAPPRGYVCHRATGPIAIDGAIDEPAWAGVPWSDPFVDIEGDLKPRPRHETRVKMLWDDEHYYIAAKLDEPDLRGSITRHDAVIFRDNDFEVFIDPDGDNHEYVELELNALNTTWDLSLKVPYRDGGKADDSYEIAGLRTAVRLSGTINRPDDRDEGWSVEIAIPWKSLAPVAHRPCPPRDGDQWRVNFSRVQWRHRVEAGAYETVPGTKEDNWVWSPQGVVDMHRPERWGYVQFTKGEVGRVALAADPTRDARDRLVRVYEAQKAFKAGQGRWAATLAELDIRSPRGCPIDLKILPGGTYEASMVPTVGVGQSRPVSIGPDSRIEVGPVRSVPHFRQMIDP